MAHRALDHSLEPDGLLQHVFIALGDFFNFLFKEALQVPENVFDVAAAVLNDLDSALVIQQSEKDVLDADILVPPLLGFPNGKSEGRG
jgi:hypothetical protein